VIFGGLGANGRLPVSIGDQYPQGYGLDTKGGIRFGYAPPEQLGIPSHRLEAIDSIVNAALEKHAMPGCQVLVSIDQNIIYQKSFGYHTYDSLIPVQNDHLYDLASVTKISGVLPALMKLYGEDKLDLDESLEKYAPAFAGSEVGQLPLREILAHQSGLIPYINYWKATLKGNGRDPWRKNWNGDAINQGKFKWRTFKPDSSRRFPVRVSNDLWLHKQYKKKIFRTIKKSPLGEKKYRYSGLIFLVFPEIVEALSGSNYHDYIYGNFYRPLGAYDITYQPKAQHSLQEIAPTEVDDFFRMQLIHGEVHDEAASMMNRRSSNAGLFANANDLAKLGQMYANYGTYGGGRYLKEEAVKEFSRCQYCDSANMRGLGFDRQREVGNTANSASELSFGHSGFTGTFLWMDPVYNLVYVFLSNRVYPTRENTLLYKMNVRTDILQTVYDLLDQTPR
jgi:CubicO group peptidase (beta-lactamase class C family)